MYNISYIDAIVPVV